jgi:hypothetical protein
MVVTEQQLNNNNAQRMKERGGRKVKDADSTVLYCTVHDGTINEIIWTDVRECSINKYIYTDKTNGGHLGGGG